MKKIVQNVQFAHFQPLINYIFNNGYFVNLHLHHHISFSFFNVVRACIVILISVIQRIKHFSRKFDILIFDDAAKYFEILSQK